MSFKWKHQRRLAILLVLGLVMAACATEGGDTTTTAGGEEPGTTAGGEAPTTTAGGEEEPSGEVLDVWVTREYYIPPDDFESFTAEHGVEVEWNLQANDDIFQQFQRMADAGQPLPDVLGAEDAFLIESYVDAGFVGSHDEIAATWEAEAPDQYASLFPLVWDETAIDGVKNGASITANFDVLYYNTEWFEEAGITVPFESLDAVLDGLRALQETRPDAIPFTVQALAGDGVTTLKTVMAAAGAPFEGAVFDLTSDGGVYAINWFLQAANEGLLPPEAIAWGEAESRGAFVAGAGMILDGFTTAADFAAGGIAFPDQWNVTPVPLSQSGDGVDGVALSAARTWAVLEGSDQPEAAALVLRYIAETDNLIEAAGNGSVPMRQTEAFNDPRLLEIWPFFNDDLKEAYLGSTPSPAGTNAGEVEAILEQMFGEIVVGTEKTAEELAAEYQPQLDATVGG